jgi:hypothetical protein
MPGQHSLTDSRRQSDGLFFRNSRVFSGNRFMERKQKEKNIKKVKVMIKLYCDVKFYEKCYIVYKISSNFDKTIGSMCQ